MSQRSRRILVPLLATLTLALLSACASQSYRRIADEAAELHAPGLRRFDSDAELRDYLARIDGLAARMDTLQDAERDRQLRRASRSDDPPAWGCEQLRNRRAAATGDDEATSLDTVEITGARIAPSMTSGDTITNNQEAGVDEGDIVKKSGDFVFVLSNGVLSVVRIRDGGRDVLALTDTLVVAETGDGEDAWYDEILAQGDRLVLLGFRFGDEEVSELRMFRVDAAGRLTRDGRYWLRSGDYFTASNYGARLQDGHLLMSISVPLDLDDDDASMWPEWSRRDVPAPAWQPLLEATDLHYPVYLGEYGLYAHVVLRCPLATLSAAQLDCQTTGIVGDARATIYVTDTDTWLGVNGIAPEALERGDFGVWSHYWNAYEAAGLELQRQQLRRTAVYRIPHDGGAPAFATVAGEVGNQFYFKQTDDSLHLATSVPTVAGWTANRLRLYRLGAAELLSRRDLETVPVADFVADFRLDYLRFGERGLWMAGTPGDDWTVKRYDAVSQVRVLPLAGGAVVTVPVQHRIETLQPLFGMMLALGHHPRQGLGLSLFTDAGAPAPLSMLHVPERDSTDDRSHALNFSRLPNGATLLGLPTMPAGDHVEASWDYELPSDLDFFALQGERLLPLGRIAMQDQVEPECEDGCEDWYGDSRVFFVGNRVFALSANLLKEGSVGAQGITVLRRVELETPKPTDR